MTMQALWTVAEVAQALGLSEAFPPTAIARVTQDSRLVQPGDLFVALSGTPSGGFNFTRTMTQGPDPRVAGSSGVGYASFLLGTGSGSVTHQIRPANSNNYKAFKS